MTSKIKPIAIYLPQFHPIPENDEWWGKGFTEWTNVTKAKPLFKGHYQPQLPSDLGFYDLRLAESRLAQEELARKYGIYGFCYYHYWFNGKRILDEPLQRKLQNDKENLPFLICWANENWARNWDGQEDKILLKQEYSKFDHIDHFNYLLPIFLDKRYIKLDSKPIFIFYRPDLIPDLENTIQLYRNLAKENGFELYICFFERWNGLQIEDQLSQIFDAGIEFQPLSSSLRRYKENIELLKSKKLINRIYNKIGKTNYKKKKKINQIIDFQDFVHWDINQNNKSDQKYFGVCPMWDNTPRRGREGTVFINSSPKLFGTWLNHKLNLSKLNNKEFIFINAWNEWAEGNHLEPCHRYGNDFLKEISTKIEK